jgi:RNA polymerase sigma-70 factor (ECF subfamily)
MSNQHSTMKFCSELKAGTKELFDVLYEQYSYKLYIYAERYLPSMECEEIVQDVMMWLWENRQVITTETTLNSLLFTMVKNKCLNRILHRQVKQEAHNKLYQKLTAQFEEPDIYVSELKEMLEKAIRNLPENYRTAFEMNRFDDMTYKEIADRLDVSEKAVAYKISQALKILKKELKDYLP